MAWSARWRCPDADGATSGAQSDCFAGLESHYGSANLGRLRVWMNFPEGMVDITFAVVAAFATAIASVLAAFATLALAAAFAVVFAGKFGLKKRWVLTIVSVEVLTIFSAMLSPNIGRSLGIALAGCIALAALGYFGRVRARRIA